MVNFILELVGTYVFQRSFLSSKSDQLETLPLGRFSNWSLDWNHLEGTLNHRLLTSTLRVPASVGMCLLTSSQVMSMLLVGESHFKNHHSKVLESGLWWSSRSRVLLVVSI